MSDLVYAGCGFVTMCVFACFVKVTEVVGVIGGERTMYKLTWNRLSWGAFLVSLAAGILWPFTLAVAVCAAGVALVPWLWGKAVNVLSKRHIWHLIDWLLTWPVNLWLIWKDREANKRVWEN